jgi:hypothetical protein
VSFSTCSLLTSCSPDLEPVLVLGDLSYLEVGVAAHASLDQTFGLVHGDIGVERGFIAPTPASAASGIAITVPGPAAVTAATVAISHHALAVTSTVPAAVGLDQSIPSYNQC